MDTTHTDSIALTDAELAEALLDLDYSAAYAAELYAEGLTLDGPDADEDDRAALERISAELASLYAPAGLPA